jgi:gp16 family phage-associated protein
MPKQSKPALHSRPIAELGGLSVKAWSEKHGFKPRTVHAILRGERKGYVGVGKKIAHALKLNEGET